MDDETIDIVDRALADMKTLGATIVDPGAERLAVRRMPAPKYNPQTHNEIFTRQFPDLFPVDANGAPVGDHIATLVAIG